MKKHISLLVIALLLLTSNAYALNLSRVKTWGAEVLTQGDLNAEFDNILNHAIGTADITDDTIGEADLNMVDTATDEDVFTYESTTGDFEWHTRQSVVDAGLIGDVSYTIGDNSTGDVIITFDGDAGTDGTITYDVSEDAFTISGSRVAIGAFTRDTATASGTQAVTGVGFVPVAVQFTMAEAGSDERSWGDDDGTNTEVIAFQVDADNWLVSAARSIYAVESGTAHYSGTITTLGADGFTITWVKTGTPTGTITVNYLAYK